MGEHMTTIDLCLHKWIHIYCMESPLMVTVQWCKKCGKAKKTYEEGGTFYYWPQTHFDQLAKEQDNG